jgi:uncharacterized protein
MEDSCVRPVRLARISVALIALCIAVYKPQPALAADSIELVLDAVNSARTGDVSKLQEAIAKGASINSRNRLGDSLLVIAIKNNQVQYALAVLDVGGDPELADAAGVTPLMAAAYYDDLPVLRALLERKVSLTATDRVKKTAMVYAAGSGHSSAVAALLDAGVPVDERYDADLTALMWAAGNGSEETVRLLLSRGANASLKDERGKTALTVAREGNFEAVVKLLENPSDGPPPRS